jgi:hypothetical protein
MKKLIGILWLAVALTPAHAQPVFATGGVAIRGYDPVAYFTDGKPVEGSRDFTFDWQGAKWRFKDSSNLKLFRAQPEKYAPQFGGYCAYGVSENHKSPTEPEAFTIVNEKLYLNYSLKVKQIWSQNREVRIQKAETNWTGLKSEKQ